VTTLWLATTWIASLSCFNPSTNSSDASDAMTTSDASDAQCSGFGCTDAQIIDPCGDASLALRARALFDQACSGGSETGCHVEFAGIGGTNLEVDRDGAPWPYDTPTANCPTGCGIIDVPSAEMPDVMRIVPYHPESSYLYWKITGDPRRAPGTGIMPLLNAGDSDSGSVDCVAHPANNGCLCAVETIGPWIEAGAP